LKIKPFPTAALRGTGLYLEQRADSVKKPHKRAALMDHAQLIANAAEHIEKLERTLKSKSRA